MSPAYLSSALPDMVLSTHEKLRQERANLWRAKHLNRQLTGDASWIPAGEVESPEDWDLFEPKSQGGQKQLSRKRKRPGVEFQAQTGNGYPDRSSQAQNEPNGVGKESARLEQDKLPARTNGIVGAPNIEKNNMADADDPGAKGDTNKGKETANAEDSIIGVADVSSGDAVMEGTDDMPGKPQINGVDPLPTERNGKEKEVNEETFPPSRQKEVDAHLEPKVEAGEYAVDQVSRTAPDEEDGSPPPPPRRITRALAANNNSNSHSNAPTPPLSPASSSTTTSSSSQLQIDSLYLVPRSANPSGSATAFHGLLPEEILETRRLLTLYIQKQEESVRGYEAILSKLLTAQRLRTEVLEMCKTEEHVGELSDGEDWIDAERWGLQPGELRKGRDEDDDVMDENTIGGRKGKRRARN
jgi:RXT2-like, N-terminal